VSSLNHNSNFVVKITVEISAILTLLAATALGQAMSQGIMSPPANVRPTYLENVGIEQHLDAQVPPDLMFVDDTGRAIKLGDYFGSKPIISSSVMRKELSTKNRQTPKLPATAKLE
jgi:hypothetical protein